MCLTFNQKIKPNACRKSLNRTHLYLFCLLRLGFWPCLQPFLTLTQSRDSSLTTQDADAKRCGSDPRMIRANCCEGNLQERERHWNFHLHQLCKSCPETWVMSLHQPHPFPYTQTALSPLMALFRLWYSRLEPTQPVSVRLSTLEGAVVIWKKQGYICNRWTRHIDKSVPFGTCYCSTKILISGLETPDFRSPLHTWRLRWFSSDSGGCFVFLEQETEWEAEFNNWIEVKSQGDTAAFSSHSSCSQCGWQAHWHAHTNNL